MAGWQVTEQAIEAMYTMSAQLQELAVKIHQETEKMKSTFEDTQDGLGAHSASIQALINEVEGTEQDASIPVKKLVLKLQRAALIRQKHIETQRYTESKGRSR
jgi:cyanate lyase